MAILTTADDVARHRPEALLASIVLQDPGRLGEVLDATDLEVWASVALRRVVEEVARLVHRDGADATAFDGVALHLEGAGVPLTGSALLAVYEMASPGQAVRPLADAVHRAASQRHTREALHQLVAAADDGEDLERHIHALQRAGELSAGSQVASMVDVVDAELDALQDEAEGKGVRVWSTGLYALDEQLSGGVREPQLVVIGGRPGMGKTALGMQIADAVASSGGRVHVYSGEMSRGQLGRRVMALWSDVHASELHGASGLTQATMDRVVRDLGTVRERGYRMLVDDRGGLAWGEVVAGVMRSAFRLGGLDMVLVDYLQLLRVPTGESEYTAYTAASKAAKGLAKQLGCVVILLCQMNRSAAGRKSKEPQVTDLRATGQIEQDADVIVFPYRPSEDDDEAPADQAALIVAKNRAGPSGRRPARWVGHLTRYEDLGVF